MANDDFADALRAFSAAGVEFVVVGAYALGAHGRPRATGDIDLLVRASASNAQRIALAVRRFAGVSLEYFSVSIGDLSRPGVGFYMGVEPNRVDVLTKIAGVSFDRVWTGRVFARIEDVRVAVIGHAELIAAKRASAKKRPPDSAKALQDLADLRALQELDPPKPAPPRRRTTKSRSRQRATKAR